MNTHVYAKTILKDKLGNEHPYYIHFIIDEKGDTTFVDEVKDYNMIKAADFIQLVDLVMFIIDIEPVGKSKKAVFTKNKCPAHGWHPALKIVGPAGEVKKIYQLDNLVSGQWLNNSHVRAMTRYFRYMPEEEVRTKAYDKEGDPRYQIFNAENPLNWELWFSEE